MSRFISVAAFAAGLAVASLASATTIDFNDIGGGPGIRSFSGTQYQPLGVVLGSNGGLYAYDDNVGTNTPPVWIYGSTSGGSSANGTVIINFVIPNTNTGTDVANVSFYSYDVEAPSASQWQAQAFDSSNAVLQTITGTGSQDLISFNFPNIRSVVFTPSADLEGIDTLSFDGAAAAVPVPSAVIGGVVLLAGTVAKRRLARRV
jgi:hypothetical protein